ncbi:MAG: hypothetical protein PVH68_06185 [Armatimonadota bacterium]|jgi:hypothetical protein
MSEDRRRILEMLAEGKISVAEADELLTAFEAREAGDQPPPEDGSAALTVPSKPRPKYLRVLVEPTENNPKGDRVNIRVPVGLLRAGVKLASVMPGETQGKVGLALKDKGIDLDMKGLTSEQVDDLVECLAELTVDVDSDKEKVRIFCE